MIFKGFCGGSASERVETINRERTVNWYAAVADSGQPKASPYLMHTPGLMPYIVLGEGPIRCLWFEDGRCFAVGGASFYEVFASQNYVRYGSVVQDGRDATISTNGTAGHQLFVTSGGHGYIFDLVANTLTEITDPDFIQPTAMGLFIDGYFASLVRGSRAFQLSDLEDGTSWSGLDVAEVSQSSDNLVSMRRHRRELWLQGSKTTAVWGNFGTANFPFAPILGAMMWVGVEGPDCTSELENSLLWVGQNENGGRTVYRSEGYEAKRVTTHAMENYLSQAPRTDDIITYSYEEEGHPFFHILVPSLPTCPVYDLAGPPEAKWHERAIWDERFARWTPHVSRCHAWAFGKHLVGDRSSPAIYEMNLNFPTDQVLLLDPPDVGPQLVGVYPTPNITADPAQRPGFALYYDKPLMVSGSDPITLTVQSSNTGAHANLVLTLDIANSEFEVTGAGLLYGKGQLLFDILSEDLTGATGVTFECSDASPRSGWDQITDFGSNAIPDSLGAFDKFLVVGD